MRKKEGEKKVSCNKWVHLALEVAVDSERRRRRRKWPRVLWRMKCDRREKERERERERQRETNLTFKIEHSGHWTLYVWSIFHSAKGVALISHSFLRSFSFSLSLSLSLRYSWLGGESFNCFGIQYVQWEKETKQGPITTLQVNVLITLRHALSFTCIWTHFTSSFQFDGFITIFFLFFSSSFNRQNIQLNYRGEFNLKSKQTVSKVSKAVSSGLLLCQIHIMVMVMVVVVVAISLLLLLLLLFLLSSSPSFFQISNWQIEDWAVDLNVFYLM